MEENIPVALGQAKNGYIKHQKVQLDYNKIKDYYLQWTQ